MIYSSDLDSVLSMFKRNTVIDYEFYFACLDKIDMLKWCLYHNPNPKICEPALTNLSNCYAKFFMYNA
jgi:hypothetical protein